MTIEALYAAKSAQNSLALNSNKVIKGRNRRTSGAESSITKHLIAILLIQNLFAYVYIMLISRSFLIFVVLLIT